MSQDFIVKLIQDIAASDHQLKRVPENDSVMDGSESVHDFNELMRTNLTVNYAASMDFLHRARGEGQHGGRVLDLCSGPGHYSACLAKYLGFHEVVGIDLSQPMVEKAQTNITNMPAHVRASYRQGNALELSPNQFEKFDVVTFVNAAHHFGSIKDVQQVLAFADATCADDGIVLLTDLCRLPNTDVSNRFIGMIGDDYLNCGLPALAEDFRASMFAAWSPAEMQLAIPKNSERTWFHVVAGALPFFQAVIGLPIGRSELFLRESKDWSATDLFRTERAQADWNLTRPNYYNGTTLEIKSEKGNALKKRVPAMKRVG